LRNPNKNRIFVKREYGGSEMITKEGLQKEIEKFPEKFSIDELIENLIVIEKIQEGERQSENGEVISEKELGKEIEKWFE